MPISGGAAGTPVLGDGIALVTGWDGKVHAVDLAARKELWSFGQFRTGQLEVHSAIAGDVAIVGDYSYGLYAVDLKTGKERWSFVRPKPSTAPASAPASAPAPAPAAQTQPAASEPADPEAAQAAAAAQRAARRAALLAAEKAKWPAPEQYFFAAAGKLVLASDHEKIRLFDASSGKEIWATGLDYDDLGTQPVIGSNAAYAGCTKGAVMALDIKTGKALWNQQMPEPPSAMSLQGELLIFRGGTKIYALDAKSGKQRWEYDLVLASRPTMFKSGFGFNGQTFIYSRAAAPLATADGVMYCMVDGKLVLIDGASGQQKQSFKLSFLPAPKSQADAIQMIRYRDQTAIMGQELTWHNGFAQELGDIAIDRTTMYFVADGCLYALDLATRQRLWRLTPTSSVVGQPVVAGGKVYFVTSESVKVAPSKESAAEIGAARISLPGGLHCMKAATP